MFPFAIRFFSKMFLSQLCMRNMSSFFKNACFSLNLIKVRVNLDKYSVRPLCSRRIQFVHRHILAGPKVQPLFAARIIVKDNSLELLDRCSQLKNLGWCG